MIKRPRQPTVIIPSEVVSNRVAGVLYGFAHYEPATFNVLSCGDPPAWSVGSLQPTPIGQLLDRPTAEMATELCGWFTDRGAEFVFEGRACRVEVYSLILDVFSRNSGIIENGALLDSTAIISGCGSVGSLVALELARAGVGRFLLIDNDVLAYQNICRHQCGISDVGKYKVDALRDRISNVNPKAHVHCQHDIIERVAKDVFDTFCTTPCLIVGCADNRDGDLYANKISCLYGVPFVSIGLWERAFAGELFWSIPGETACYNCVFGGLTEDVVSFRVSANRRVYTNEPEMQVMAFEPGISMDITFVTIIGAKLALDLMSRQVGLAISTRTIHSLKQFTLVCNTPDTKVAGDLAAIFSYPLQITRSIRG